MKKTLALLSILLALSPSARAGLLFEEGFDYAAGTTLGLKGPWGSGNNNITVGSANLTYSGLADAVNPGNDMSLASGSSGSVVANFSASAVSSGSIYYSFLAQCTALPTANNYLTDLLAPGVSPNGSGDPLSVYVGAAVSGSSFRLGIRHAGNGSGATYTTNNTAFVLNAVNLFVVKYTFGPNTGDDSVSLFVNPTPGGAEPTADVTVSGGTDASSLQGVGFKAQSATSAGNWSFDTLRVGDAWGDVVPTIAAPEPTCGALALVGLAVFAVRRRFSR